MNALTFAIVFFVRLDLSECPFDAFDGRFAPFLRHADMRPRFRIPVIVDIGRKAGAEHLASIPDLPDGLGLQENRNKEKKNDESGMLHDEQRKSTLISTHRPGCHFGGIVLKSGRKGFAIYREGEVIEQFSVIGR